MSGDGAAVPPLNRGFTIHQKVGLDVEFSRRTLKGWTEITIIPTDPNLKAIGLNARQCTLTHISIDGRGPLSKYTDSYSRFRLHEMASVHQHQQLRERLEPCLKDPLEPELVVSLPKDFKLELQDPSESAAQNSVLQNATAEPSATGSPAPNAPTPAPTARPENTAAFKPVTLRLEFIIEDIRDGFHFVGSEDDMRLPHAYTLNTIMPGSSSCLFPCIDSLWDRHTWDIQIICPRTLGDIGKAIQPQTQQTKSEPQNGIRNTPADTYRAMNPFKSDKDFTYSYEGDDGELDFVVVCSGEHSDEIIDPHDPSKKVCSFQLNIPTAPQHIAFAVGPFEKANLTEFRESEEDDAMGINAVEIHGYGLPGRLDDVKNACMFMQKAIDHFVKTFGIYSYDSFKLCFVDDLPDSTVPSASLAICSNRILFGEDQIDPIYPATRQLTHALASQWSGISVLPKTLQDVWIVVGIAHYMTTHFLRKLLGNNEYRFKLKKDTERLCALDIDRPSLHDHGLRVPFGPGDFDFIALKAPLVLYILDRRLTKGTHSLGLGRVLPKIFLQATSGDLDASLLSTASFIRVCEKVGHTKLDQFFEQWVFGTGCPRFEISQRFNKKKMIVEMIIRQLRNRDQGHRVSAEGFIEDAIGARKVEQPDGPAKLFTGPMTIRIHEADGTPYEHVVELKEWSTKLEIPYNTKYKRLKRTKRQKERMAATAGADVNADAQAEDGVLLYCLGDVLQSEEDMADWRLSEWSKEQEDKMSQEAFEWIRVDADFEWLCTITINQPDHMFLSQLQQDRDVNAQYEAVKHFRVTEGSLMRSTILVRTVMDRRYYYGIRAEAARALSNCATPALNWIGRFHLEKAFQEFYCFPNSSIPMANDFSDFTSYFVQNAIVSAMSEIRDKDGSSPQFVQRFLLDLLRYNENSNNAFADHYYVSTVMKALQTCVREKAHQTVDHDMGMNFDFEDDDDEVDDTIEAIISEIERFQRMDQWLPSFHNIVSTTALEFKKHLVLTKHRESDLREFLAYAREDTLDVVRIKAIQCMIELGALNNPGLLGYICTILSDDPSPYIRRETMKAFLTGLGAIATGENTTRQGNADASGEVIIEDEHPNVNNTEKAAESLEGALDLFRKTLKDNEVMQQAIWKALCAPTIGLIEMRKLLDICTLLYEEKRSFLVRVPYHRQRKLICTNAGNGRVRFIWNPTRQQIAKLLPPTTQMLTAFEQLAAPPKPRVPEPEPEPEAGPELDVSEQPAPPKRAFSLTLKPPKDPNPKKESKQTASKQATPKQAAPKQAASKQTAPKQAAPKVATPKQASVKAPAKAPKIKLKSHANNTPTPPPQAPPTPASAPEAAPPPIVHHQKIAPAPTPPTQPKIKLKLNMAKLNVSAPNGSSGTD